MTKCIVKCLVQPALDSHEIMLEHSHLVEFGIFVIFVIWVLSSVEVGDVMHANQAF